MADVSENLARFQKAVDGAFIDIQNNLNAQRQVYNQALNKLNDDVLQSANIRARLAQEQVQNECNRQVADLTRQIQEIAGQSNYEKSRLQVELQTQSQNADARFSETSKSYQNELARVRSELNEANVKLYNLRRQWEGHVNVAQSEFNRIQSQHEYGLQNIKKKLELTRQDGDKSYRNAQRIIQQYV